MDFESSKLLCLHGSMAANKVKVGVFEPDIEPDTSKLLALQGGEAANAVKVGPPEPVIEPDSVPLDGIDGYRRRTDCESR